MENQTLFEFITISRHRMVSHYLPKFIRCLEEMTDFFIWESPDGTNSIGGITLHVVEHIERNRNRYINPECMYRDGIEKTFPKTNETQNQLINRVREVFQNWDETLKKMEPKNIGMYDLYHLVEHTGYHLGQIVDRTQRITGKRFSFVDHGINEKNLKLEVERELEKGTGIP
ncbi:DinB family protein [Paenibacillus sp. SN-8-1]|uniref:DinB family protein n=1 Tax=Paenibacillus sp. SN-8-1 TaxID=3435409 RepID=UPI003D9A917F